MNQGPIDGRGDEELGITSRETLPIGDYHVLVSAMGRIVNMHQQSQMDQGRAGTEEDPTPATGQHLQEDPREEDPSHDVL